MCVVTINMREDGSEDVDYFTWALDTVTEVDSEFIHNVQQEGEIIHIVHVNIIRL